MHSTAVHRMLRAFVASLWLLGTAASASTFTSDITDMWWNAAESGWGVNVTQQYDTAFLTFFVYDVAGKPVWYTAIARWDSETQGRIVWTGPMYATTGSWFGGPYAPGPAARAVGSVTFTQASVSSATLVYSIDGVSVSKNVERQTWRFEDYSYDYVGASSLRYSGCPAGSPDGIRENSGSMQVRQAGDAFQMTMQGNVAVCSYTGNYTQSGRLGRVAGNYSCGSETGTFVLYEMTSSLGGFSARMFGAGAGCTWSGYFGSAARAD